MVTQVIEIDSEYIPVKLPKDLIDDMDKLVGKHGFKSRAEIAKEAIRRLLSEFKTEEKEA